LNNIKIPFPDYQKQKQIANILSSLDDKIELNRQMCKTLEDIASTLFKSWFIEFEPVKAKAAGREPEGMSREMTELFPDSFVDSSLGPIPKGWEISELGKIAKNIKRNIKSSPETEILPYVPIDCITSTSLALHNHMPGILAKTSLIKFEKWQILFGAMRPYFHKVCIAPFVGTTRTTAFVLDPINSVDFGFLLITVFQKTTIDFAVNTSQGSTIPYAVWEGGMAKMPIILPPKDIRQVYNQATINIFEKILSITEQNETLSLIRDLLLPKLMNGEVKIQEAGTLISAII
jgi:type I restriction enzyme S subunit